MIAYNREWLDNINTDEELQDAYDDEHISLSEKEEAKKQYPVGFYTPNIFIRIGLYILTIIIVFFTFGLFSLFGLEGSGKSIGGIAIFFGLASLVALEIIVKNNNHYRSGVDDALLLVGAVAIISGLNVLADLSALANAVLIFVFALYGAIRYTDRLMAPGTVLALLAIIFYALAPLGVVAKSILPFVLMLATATIYFTVQRLKKISQLKYYSNCFTIASIAALTCFYIAGNFFAVKETGESLLGVAAIKSNSLPLGWLFWLFTICVPLLYIGWGIAKKDIILIRAGLLLIAAAVFTVRYYYIVMPAEIAMILAGVLLITISYLLQRWLKQPRGGFTLAPSKCKREQGFENIEALLIAETLGHGQEQPATKFGGGGFGGGGASGDF